MTTFPIATSPREPAYTLEELRQVREEIDSQPRRGLIGLAEDAIDSEWSTSWYARWNQGQRMPVDPDFRVTEDLVKELGDGVDPGLWGEFSRAESLTHAYYIRETLRDVQDARKRLASAGVTGAALGLGAAIIDPGFLAGGALLEIGTAGIGTGAAASAKASRIRGLVRGGFLATATDVPIQAFISTQDPDQGAREVLFTLAGGTILGGGLGALGAHLRSAKRLQRDLEFEELQETVGAMGSAGQRSFLRPFDRIQDMDPSEFKTIAFHGSPNKFNEFRTSEIGSGEGAQTYGYGLYFSSKKEVGEFYRDAYGKSGYKRGDEQIAGEVGVMREYFKPGRVIKTEWGFDKVIEFRETPGGASPWQVKVQRVDQSGSPIKSEAPRIHATSPPQDRIESVLGAEGWARFNDGALYEVAIRPSRSEMLDLDKPIVEQSDSVRAAIPDAKPGQTGESYYRALSSKLGGDKAASEELSKMGIPGLSYIGTTSGARNFVVFKESDVVVKSINGEPMLTPKGRAYFAEQVDPAVKRERVENMLTHVFDPERDVDTIDAVRAMEPDDALRLMDDLQRQAWNPPPRAGEKAFPRTAEEKAALEGAETADGAEPPEPPPLTTRAVGPEDFDASWAIDGVARIGDAPLDKARLPTFTVQLGRVKGRLTRMFGAASLHDNLIRADGAALGDNAETFSRRMAGSRMAVYNRETGDAFRRFTEARGVRGTAARRREFNRLVTQAIREGWKGVDADVEAAAGTVARLHADLLDTMKRHGVPGFEDVPADPQYVMRVWNVPAIHALDQAHGGDVLNQLIEAGIRAKTPDIDEKLLKRIVTGFSEEIRSLDQVSFRAKSAMLDGQNADALAELLRKWGMPEQDIEQVLYRVSPQSKDTGKINRAKHRLLMDETVSVTAPDGTPINLQQLLEDDVDALFSTYLRETVGAAASREVYRALSLAIDPDGGVDIKTWDQLKQILATDLQDAGHARGEVEDILRVAEMVDRHIKGMPMRDRVRGQDFWRRMRGIGHIIYSGGFGLTQQIEWGTVAGEASMRAVLRQVPALREIIGSAAKGNPPPGFLARVEALSGIGADHVNSRFLEHFDYKDAVEDAGIMGSKADRRLHAGSRIANVASLMTPTLIVQKRWAVTLATQQWLDIARSGKAPSAKRLAVLGLDEATGKRIAEGVRKHAKTESGVLGERFTDLDLDAWLRDDPATAGAYIRALDRWASRVIQSGDIGSTMPWTTGPFGRVITQFRTFVLQAWEKQFLHRAQMRDPAAFVGAAATFMMSMLVYAARTHIQAAGRADREEFLRDRLRFGEVVAGGFRYAGFNAFMPDVIDTILPREYQLFSRNSGLATDVFDIGQAPVPSMLGAGAKAIGTALTAPLDGRFTREEWRPFSRLMFYRNVAGVRNLLDWAETRLPEDDE